MFKRFTSWLAEDVAANAAGLGGVAALGVGPKGEPGVDLRKNKKKVHDPRLQIASRSPLKEAYIKEMYSEYDVRPRCQTEVTWEEVHAAIRQYGKPLKTLGDVRAVCNIADANNRKQVSEAKAETCECSHPRTAHEGLAGECSYCECLEYVPWGTLKEAVKPVDTFAGAPVFEVDMDTMMSARMGKNRYHRYSRYVGTDEVGESIRKHGRKHGGDIILKDSKTRAMSYLRRKPPVGE